MSIKDTQETLNYLKCSNPGCTEDHPLVLHSKCHPKKPTWVSYDKSRGSILVFCSECENPIAEIAVARSLEH